MSAYDDAAEIIVASGFWPIPILGKSVPVVGTTGYDGTVDYPDINNWLHPDRKVREKAGRYSGYNGIALKHVMTVAVDIDDGYGTKSGVAQLRAYAERLGLSPLPATISSTARGDDSPSRQLIYRLKWEEGGKPRFKTKPCPSVELCCWHHRFTVCAPTIHPDNGKPYAFYEPGEPGVPPTWGERMDRYPVAKELAYFPDDWMEVVRNTTPELDPDAEVVEELTELVATFPEGDPDGLIAWLIAKWSDPANHVGHDEYKNALINALMHGRAGRPGVPQLVDVLHQRYADYLNLDRPAVAQHEQDSLTASCVAIAQQKRLPTATERVEHGVEEMPKASNDQLGAWLNSFTRFDRPGRLGRRVEWMTAGSPDDLSRHAVALIDDTFAGYLPATKAAAAIRDALRHHGVDDNQIIRDFLAHALGATIEKVAL